MRDLAEYYGKNLTEEEYDQYSCEADIYGVDYLYIKEKSEKNMAKAIRLLNEEYESLFECKSCDIELKSKYFNSCNIEYVIYKFTVIIDKNISKDISVCKKHKGFRDDYIEYYEIKRVIENYYKANIKKMYEGEVEFEGWFVKDYQLDGQYMSDIFHELLGKKIKITILDD